MKQSLPWIFALCILALAACAGGADQPLGPEPALVPDQARLYVYRYRAYNASLAWTTVSLDHHPLGESAPGTVFYRDVPPGIHEIEVRSDKLYPNQFKTVRLAAGSRTFVRIDQEPYWGNSPWGWQGMTFVVTIIDPALGARQIAGLHPTSG